MTSITSKQQYSLALATSIIEECALFCEANLLRAQEIDETLASIVACQSALLALLANHRHGDVLRIKIAESMVDGTAADYIAYMKASTQMKGTH
jgi:hypothetical protein